MIVDRPGVFISGYYRNRMLILDIRDWGVNQTFLHEYSPGQGDLGMYVHTLLR
jgi:hypothetical protein